MEKKRTEILLDFGFWMRLKKIALSERKTLSALFRQVLMEYVTDYEQTKKTPDNDTR